MSTIATVGNYEYGFFWYLYLDGNIQLEVKLTGIVSPMAIEPGTQPEFANVVAPGRRGAAPPAPVQRRGSTSTSTAPRTRSTRSRPRRCRPGPTTRGATRSARTRPRLESEVAAQRETNAATSRCWKVVNPHVHNGLGQPVAYKLVPTMSTPTLLAHPDSSVGKRAGFAQHNLWVTPYARRRAPRRRRATRTSTRVATGSRAGPRGPQPRRYRRRASGTRSASPTSCAPRTGRSCRSSTPASCSRPFGFFDRNPALDLPPSHGHCHRPDPDSGVDCPTSQVS